MVVEEKRSNICMSVPRCAARFRVAFTGRRQKKPRHATSTEVKIRPITAFA